ncbi:MAG TPA: hypothetical protein VFA97_05190 [Gaiellaceae bacterium]|nr:hypothetical protein [Gaiellaceae bacterium]
MEPDKPENGEEAIDEQGRNPTQQRIDEESTERPDDVQDADDD